MYVISVNNKTAGSALRGELAVSDTDMPAFLRSVSGKNHDDTVVVCTCNRTEVYGEGTPDHAISELSQKSGVDSSLIRDHCLVFADEDAIKHLFRVCAGLDSMVIGEDEILGQVRNSAKCARQAGTYGNSFPQIFQAAFAAAKKVKTDTLLSKTSVSVATIAASYCHRFTEGSKRILMIGAGGDIGTSLRKDLLSYGDCEITATVHRTRFKDDNIRLIDYHDRYSDIGEYDIIISATKSPHYTITKTRLTEHELPAKRRLFVDLAVPSDIDPEVLTIPEASLITIDDFKKLAKENNDRKATAVEIAEQIIDDEEQTLIKELLMKKIILCFSDLTDKYGNGFKKFVFDYKKQATADDFSSFADTLISLK